MMETLLCSLLIAYIGGLTWLAYNHQQGYKKLHLPILYIIALTYTVLSTWDTALSKVPAFLLDVLEAGQVNRVIETLKSKRPPPFLGWLLIGLFAYSLFLAHILLNLLKEDKDSNKDKEVREE